MAEKLLADLDILAVVIELKTLTGMGNELFDGARETLETFREAGIRMSVIALENSGWVGHTLGHLGVGRYFSHIETVSGVNPFYGNIGSQDWRRAFDGLGFWPQNGAIVGYGLPGDIDGIGVKYHVRVLSSREMYSARKKRDERTINVESISHVVTALLATV